MFWLLEYSVSQLVRPISSIMVTVFSLSDGCQRTGFGVPFSNSASANLPAAEPSRNTCPRPPGSASTTTQMHSSPPIINTTVCSTSVQITASMPPIMVYRPTNRPAPMIAVVGVTSTSCWISNDSSHRTIASRTSWATMNARAPYTRTLGPKRCSRNS